MLKKIVSQRIIGSKLISTNPTKRTTEAINITKRDDYYKHLGAQNDDTRPAGWEESLPFEAVPGPKPLPLLGNLWRFLPYIGEYHNLHLQEFHKRLRDKYGDIIHFKGVVGRKSIVMIYNPDDIAISLRNAGPFPIRQALESFVYYRNYRKDIFKGTGGLFTVQGEDWFKVRSVLNPIFMQPRTAEQYIGHMDEVANELIENMKYFSMNDKNNEMPKDFQNELYKWTLESIGAISLDRRLGCLNLKLEKESDSQKFIDSTIQMFNLMYKLDILPPIWKIFSTPSWNKYVKILDYITQTTQKYIEEVLNKDVDENVRDHELSVLQKLAKLDKGIAVAMVTDTLIAGVDTTGKTMAAALYFLAKNPEKQKLLREEVLKNLPDKNSPVTKEILSESAYLKAVIKETTRMAPIAIGTLRTSVKDLVLSGYQIPKDTEVMCMNLFISNSEHFKDPEKFIPERWLRTTDDEYSHKNVHPFVFLPFGFGPRSCVGKRFANLELEVGLLKVIRNFVLSWPHEDMVFSAKFLYGVQSPLKLKVIPLNK